MTEDQDAAGEVVSGLVRVALTAAGQLAEQAARRREAELREAERHSTARAATLQSQLAAERELALRSVRDVIQRGDAATGEEVVRAWEQARGWDDPTMASDRASLEDRIFERFGVDTESLVSDRTQGAQVAASAIVGRDIEVQAADSRLRASGHEEAISARAVAADSHPTPTAQAAQKPRGVAAAVRLREPSHREGVVLQEPGR